jgi:RNA polymerase sigma factor (sigma-70 family)
MDALVLSAISGSSESLSDLLVMSRPYAISTIKRFIGTKYSAQLDVEDVLQEVLMDVSQKITACSASNWREYLGWLGFACRNTTYGALDKVKAKRRSADRTQRVADDFDPESRMRTPQSQLETKETLQQVLRMANSMPGATPKVIQMLSEGCTSQEIASDLGITVSAVYNLVKRFRAQAACLVA